VQPLPSEGLSSGKDLSVEDPTEVVRCIASPHSGLEGVATHQIPQLMDQWKEKYPDLFGSIPLELPPFREVNHEINLMDLDKCIHYHLPKCPEHY
jgi:hypothetical protein